jgi:hypothetical protein
LAENCLKTKAFQIQSVEKCFQWLNALLQPGTFRVMAFGLLGLLALRTAAS